MFSLALRGLMVRKLRAALTVAAIFFGVAMVAGTLMLTDTINGSFDDLFQSANAKTDVTVKPRETVQDSHGGAPPAFDASLLQKVKSVPGVAEAAGSISDPSIAILDKHGKRIGHMGPPHIAGSVVPNRFSSWTYIQGRAPTGPDEVAFDSFTAKDQNYKIGQSVRIAGAAGVKRYRIVGVARFGNGEALGGSSLALLTLREAQRLTNKVGKYDEILIAAKAGVSPKELKARVEKVTPPTVTVRTGQETAQAESQDIKDAFGFLSTALLAFAGIALLVGGFLIFNTFSITVSQRTREFGLLRTIGGSSRQVLATVLFEALFIGLAASLLGILGGIGFVALITALFKSLGFELPTSGLVISGNTVLVALVVGLVSTLASSFVPALRATRVTPMEALRDPSLLRQERPSGRRTVVASALTAAGAIAILWGLFATSSAGTAFKLMGPGLVLLFIGIAMLASRWIRPIASLVGWPIERVRGLTGRLARENTLRNPGRTTTTAAALMIGLALVAFVATFASSLSKSFDNAIDQTFAGDLALVNTDGFSRIPAGVTKTVRDVPGVSVASPLASGDGRIEGAGKKVVSGIDPKTVGKVATLDWRKGSDATLASLGATGAIAESKFAEDNNFSVGDRVSVETPTGKVATYTVRGTARDEPGVIVQSIAVPIRTFAPDFGIDQLDSVLVSFAPGTNFDAVRARVDHALARTFPNVESRSQEQLKEDTRKQINQLLVLIYALLALSVIISLFGVVNTLVLTIHERTREIGMLRAIGTSRSQVRQMIRYESVITAMIGAIIGLVIGLLLAVVAVTALADEGFTLSVPVELLAVMLILAAIAGVVAAILPARRASRINVIEALQYE